MRSEQMQTCLASLLERTLKLGADAADARIGCYSGMTVEARLGEVSILEREQVESVSLRALFGRRQAHVSGSDLGEGGLSSLVERVCAMARVAPEDPWCGLAESQELESAAPELDLGGEEVPDFSLLKDRAFRAEAAALGVEGVSRTEHVGATWENSETWLAGSNGFLGCIAGGLSSISVVAIAGEGDGMERDYEERSWRKAGPLPQSEEIGRVAGERAVRRLSPRRMESGVLPVIFDRRLSAGLLRAFIGAISGPAVARGVSFLKDSLGDRVFAPGVSIVDDPLRAGGYGSRAFDGEGRPVCKRDLVEGGVLTQWLLSGPSARQLGLRPNGFSSPGFGEPPGVSVSNLDLLPGSASLEELMREAGDGLLVTDMFSPSVNPNTGDYSVGVSGFRFEGGERSFPVSEVTIAGDLPGMFSRLKPGNVLERRNSVNAPDLLIDGMVLGGV